MREELLAALAARSEAVAFDGKTLTVRELDCASDVPQHDNAVEMSLALVVLCVCDGEGQPVFTAADLPKLRRASRKRIRPLLDAVMRVNGFNLEAETKNSEAVPGSG